MKVIKFRARNRETDKWVYSIEEGLVSFFTGIVDGQLDSGTLSQFTGLYAKNRKDIYEGDIVYNKWTNCYGEDIGDNWLVKFGEHETDSGDYYTGIAYGYFYENKKGEQTSSLVTDTGEDLEIIGNIFENPELLR